jgi:TrpR-related protein YerC/YecD
MGMQNTPSMDRLFRAVLALRTPEECRQFFEDLCTVQELRDMSQRLEVAALLDSGMKYGDVSGAAGVSTATISRVNRCLQYGSGGYRLILEREKEKNNGTA